MIKVTIQVEDDGRAILIQGRIRDDDEGALEVLASTALEMWRTANVTA